MKYSVVIKVLGHDFGWFSEQKPKYHILKVEINILTIGINIEVGF